MDHYSILDHGDPAPANPAIVTGHPAVRTGSPSISTQIAAANAKLNDIPENATASPQLPSFSPRFPGEDSGRSLAEMAQSDLDAALQLLSERALYITGASGAAIALRRNQRNDMICRASVGDNAPELGALLSMEYGLSGESVRTRQSLRCDNAERDPRVNQELCRELGIASVVVMPIVSEESILGVFELFSSQPNLFGERDLSALRRLAQMVEIAVKHASPATLPSPATDTLAPKPSASEQILPTAPMRPEEKSATVQPTPPAAEPVRVTPEKIAPEKVSSPSPPKPLFWSAAARIQSSPPTPPVEAANAVPPALRNLQKCQACGFPVSQGRTYCVECEEKKWRGQRSSPTGIAAQAGLAQVSPVQTKARPVSPPPQSATLKSQEAVSNESAVPAPRSVAAQLQPTVEPLAASSHQLSPDPQSDTASAPDNSAPFLSSALPTESWFSSNKYILIALLVVAAIIGTIVWLR